MKQILHLLVVMPSKLSTLGIEPYFDIKKLKSASDFTSSYSYENDIIYPYLEAFFYKDLESTPPPTEEQFNKMKTALFVSSNCGVKDRINFMSKLMKLVPVDSKGGCLNNSPQFHGHWTKIRHNLSNQYKFYISIEKTKEDGYVSEKFETGFLINSIPVYYGPKEADDLINPKAFIHIDSLDNPEAIASQILRLSNNYTEWLNVFNFRNSEFHRKAEVRKWIEYIKYANGRRDRGNLCRFCDFYCEKYAH